MAPKRVALSRRALADLEHIEDYISERNPRAAGRVIRSIRNSLSLLELHPKLGRPAPSGGGRVLVEPRYRYVIAYLEAVDRIEVRYIFHPRRKRP